MSACNIKRSELTDINSDPLLNFPEVIDTDLNLLFENRKHMECEDIKFLNTDNFIFKILHLNIHSVVSKIDQLKFLLLHLQERNNHEIYFIFLCKTYITDLNVNTCDITGYTEHQIHRKFRKIGGVVIYI